MQTTPWGTTRFSFFLRNSFLRLEVAFAGAPAAAPAASWGSLATCVYLLGDDYLLARRNFLFGRHCALALPVRGARVGVSALAVHGQVALVTQSAVAPVSNQTPNIDLNFFARMALDPVP